MSALSPWQQRVYEGACTALVEGRLGHALLLTGPQLLGKRDLAERLAMRLLCSEARGVDFACGTCRSCRLYQQRSQRDPIETRPGGALSHPDGHPGHPDARFVGYALNEDARPKKMYGELVVEQVRQLGEWFSLSSGLGRAQVALIEPADQLNPSAANALLKTLEEPSSDRYLLLVASEPGRLPATIRSRCHRLEFRLPPREESLDWLQARGHAHDSAEMALDIACGHPGLADDWLAQGGLQLRRELQADLNAIAGNKVSPAELAQRWLADDQAELRLRFASEIALAAAKLATGAVQSGTGGLTATKDFMKLSAWFDAMNRIRGQLRAPVRNDLVLAGLLREWRTMTQ